MQELIPLFVATFLALGACTTAQRVGVNETIKSFQDANDTAADALTAAVCQISVGAKNRMTEKSKRDHVEGLCGGEK